MGMVVQHNLPAMNAHRQMGVNNNSLSKSLEKLSSGYAINRAADNAAGLAISEKMRGQINGLNQASKNAQDGISLIQTAEGALNETHSILQRMRELSVQSSNGTYQDEVDRENIQKEVEALKSEIDRISSSTHYNNIKLLDGSLSASGSATGTGSASAAGKIALSDKAMNDGAWSVTKAEAGVYSTDKAMSSMSDGSTNDYTFTYKDESGQDQTVKLSLTFDKANGKITSSNGTSYASNAGNAADVANALKGAIEKSGMGESFKVSVGADNKMSFTAKTEGTSGAEITSISQKTSGVESKITGKVDAANGAIELDLSNIDINKIKDGDSLTIGGKKITFGNATNNAGTTAGTVDLSKVTDTASLVTELTTALAGANGTTTTPTFDLGLDAPTGVRGITANGNKITISFQNDGSEINSNQSVAKEQLQKVMEDIEYSAKGAGTFDLSKTITNVTPGAVGGAANKVVFDLANIDFSKAKAGDTFDFAGITFTFAAATNNGNNEIAVGSSATIVAKALKDSTGTALPTTFGGKTGTWANNGTQLTFTETAASTGDLTVAAETALAGPNVGYTQSKGGVVGTGSSIPTNYSMDVTKSASDRYESIDFNQMSAWDASNANDNILDHVVDVNGEKFLFVADNTIDQANLKKAVEALGNDVNIVKTNGTTLTSSDVSSLADRIQEKTGTNVKIDTTNNMQLNFMPGENGGGSANGDVGVTFQIGANGSKDQRVTLSVDDMSSKGIGVAKVDVGTREAANASIDVIDKAINQVSGTRADLGALQNRLEHTIASLDVSSENLTASESRIRDVDMAKEMMAFSKSQILSQASQAMLAQANTLPQGVLQLLQ